VCLPCAIWLVVVLISFVPRGGRDKQAVIYLIPYILTFRPEPAMLGQPRDGVMVTPSTTSRGSAIGPTRIASLKLIGSQHTVVFVVFTPRFNKTVRLCTSLESM
jgi:hypothetical protein